MTRVASLSCLLLTALPAFAGDRPLRVALYPYVPARAEAYWQLERAFEATHDVDLTFVDLAYDYYGGDLRKALEAGEVDVVEVDTVLLEELVRADLLDGLDDLSVDDAAFLPVAASAARVDDVRYGVPHWVCGNFLFYRAADPEADRIHALTGLSGLRSLVGAPYAGGEGLYIDLRGSSTLGEKYLDALFDLYGADAALEKVRSLDLAAFEAAEDPVALLDPAAIQALDRVFGLCPGGLCDSDKHHDFGQYYARAFARGDVRFLVGYSERLHFVEDEWLHGIRDGSPALGKPRDPGVGVVAAPLADGEGQHLAWVDVLAVREGLSKRTRRDAVAFVTFAASEAAVRTTLTPAWGQAPRYLLPARRALYTDPALTEVAPLYPAFLPWMEDARSASGPALNTQLRAIGKALEARPFQPFGG
jgi:thiamine pyridinylase